MITSSKLKNYNIQDFKFDKIYTMAGGVITFDGAIVIFFWRRCFHFYVMAKMLSFLMEQKL
jgi:hypothetical protein